MGPINRNFRPNQLLFVSFSDDAKLPTLIPTAVLPQYIQGYGKIPFGGETEPLAAHCRVD